MKLIYKVCLLNINY